MFIYAITNDKNAKVYVGLHSGRDLRRRWCTHRSFAMRGSRSLISRAIRKYGAEKFHITSLWSGHISIERLYVLERYFIQSLGTRSPNGYNLTDGGDGTLGYRHSEEECRKRSERMKGHLPPWTGKKRPLEVGRRISAAKTGKKRSPQSPEWRAKISASLIGNKRSLGNKVSSEVIARRVASRAGYSHSEETRNKISNALKVRRREQSN